MPTSRCAWSQPPVRPKASYDQVHLWRVSLDQPAEQVQSLAELLSADERDRASRFHFEQDRERFVVGRGVLRAILGSYLGIPASQVQFSYGPQGKPALADTSGQWSFSFNLAHAGDLALYAVTLNRELGVDVEHIHTIPDATRITEHFFAAQERDALDGAPGRAKAGSLLPLLDAQRGLLEGERRGAGTPPGPCAGLANPW